MYRSAEYHTETKDGAYIFETASFRADRGSILHSGIYNRELASSLAAGACITLSGFFFAGRLKLTAAHSLAALVFFVILFLVFRTYIFRDPVLRITVDKERKEIAVSRRSWLSTRSVSFPLKELKGVRQDYISAAPANPDGEELVGKIALQHGTAIPGFGKTQEFYTVELELHNGKTYMVYSSEDPAQADEVSGNLKSAIFS